MRKTCLFIGLAFLLWGNSSAIGQIFSVCDPCEPVGSPCDPACEPCESLCDPCDPCGKYADFLRIRPLKTPLTFSGWVDMGVYTNSHGLNNNGPMYTGSKRRTDLVMNQLYLSFAKEMDTRRGFDWGARTDLVYGAHAGSMQTYDGTFDAGWGANKHGYAMSAYKVYGTLGYKDLSVKIGKFGTPIGWEASASKDNFFYSHSYCYWIEPATHMGVVADYALTDRLTFSAGWVTGEDASFSNPNRGNAILTGFEYALSDDATVYYWINAGEQKYYAPDETFTGWNDYFVQSLCLEWNLTDRFTYVLQYNLRNDNERGGYRTSTYGVNNHFLYKLSDQWGVGTRFEWLRDNGGWVHGDPADYYQVTLGLNWNPYKNVSIRPEVRYDWSDGSKPFGPSPSFGGYPNTDRHTYQVSGGCGVVVSF